MDTGFRQDGIREAGRQSSDRGVSIVICCGSDFTTNVSGARR